MSTKNTTKRGIKNLNKKLGPMTIGKFLRSWRLSEELTQKDFAEQLGISSANLCDIEKGRKGVSIEKAQEIAETIGYSPTVLVGLAIAEQIQAAGLNYDIEIKPANKKKAS